MSRCTGHCCKSFHLPISPEVFKEDYQRFLEWKKDPKNKPEPRYKEIGKIYEMLVFQGKGKREFVDGQPVFKEGGRGFYYTCKHWNSETGDCMNYEHRPEMCRLYPYGGVCDFPGCTLKPGDDNFCKKKKVSILNIKSKEVSKIVDCEVDAELRVVNG